MRLCDVHDHNLVLSPRHQCWNWPVSGKYTHDSYNLDTNDGSYREYRGGEHSSDRSANK